MQDFVRCWFLRNSIVDVCVVTTKIIHNDVFTFKLLVIGVWMQVLHVVQNQEIVYGKRQ